MGELENLAAEQGTFLERAILAGLLDMREELRFIKIIMLKNHIETTHICDTSRGVFPTEDKPWLDTSSAHISNEEANQTIMAIEAEQNAMNALAKTGEVLELGQSS